MPRSIWFEVAENSNISTKPNNFPQISLEISITHHLIMLIIFTRTVTVFEF